MIMKQNNSIPYSGHNEELTLRDHLAIERTMLANERNLLAYIRTALAFFVAGVTFIRFFNHFVIEIIGWIFIPIGILVLVFGAVKYKNVRTKIKKIRIT